MAQMLEMIRESKVPANIMRSAAKGALALPSNEMIEILVHLAGTQVFGEQARMTLAGWDEASSKAAASDAATPPAVLTYFVNPRNLRPALLPALLENPSVGTMALAELAHTAKPDSLPVYLASPRLRSSRDLLHAVRGNPALSAAQMALVDGALAALGETRSAEAAQTLPVATDEHDAAHDAAVAKFIAEHAAEIAADEGKKFQMVGERGEVLDGLNAPDAGVLALRGAPTAGPGPAAGQPSVSAAAATAAQSATATAPAAAPAAAPGRDKDAKGDVEPERLSVVQKIARMKVGDRVQLAMKGTKDERFVLIRDGSKVVSLAVLESPKVSDQEIETFAAMKNVQEDVLRGIARKRKYMSIYSVTRNLVNNPRCPLDMALGLVSHLLVNDLKNLSMNKNVPDTVRKLALKMFREKSSGKKGE